MGLSYGERRKQAAHSGTLEEITHARRYGVGSVNVADFTQSAGLAKQDGYGARPLPIHIARAHVCTRTRLRHSPASSATPSLHSRKASPRT
jgi:hypothetical protein